MKYPMTTLLALASALPAAWAQTSTAAPGMHRYTAR